MRRARPISSAMPRRFGRWWTTAAALAALALLLWSPHASAQTPEPSLRIVAAPALPPYALVGQTLTPTPGSWEGPTGATVSYEWQRCDGSGNLCAMFGTGSAQPAPHPVTAADVGHTLWVRVTVSAGANTVWADSNPAQVPSAPSNTARPTVAGNAQAGAVLLASKGEWAGTPPLTIDYAWERCGPGGSSCSAVPGATTASYSPTTADVGLTLRVQVTASNPAGTSAVVSDRTAVVAPAPVANLEPPKIVGAAEVERSLTAMPGRWSASGGIEFAFRWLRCNAAGSTCDAIPGANSATYEVRLGDVGSRLRVRVTAIADGGSSMAESALTPVVPPGARSFSQPGPTPAGPAFMRPFPRVRIKGFYTSKGARLQLVTIKGPKGTRIRLACRGESCAFRRRTVQGRARVRLRSLERFHPAGTRIVIRVSGAGEIGKYTRITIRAARPPARRDRCLLGESARAVRCPPQSG
jgi:hypothetical protein